MRVLFALHKGFSVLAQHTIRDIIFEPRREHSRKPEAFVEKVNELCPGRKLEYFSREKREGREVQTTPTQAWVVWDCR